MRMLSMLNAQILIEVLYGYSRYYNIGVRRNILKLNYHRNETRLR